MEKSELLKRAEKIIEDGTEKFIQQIKWLRQDGPYDKNKKADLDFSIFSPLNADYSELKFFEGKLAEYIRDYLVLTIFDGLFYLHNINVSFFNSGKICVGESHRQHEQRIPYEFLINDNGVRTGFRFDHEIDKTWKIKPFIKLHLINQIEILVFDNNVQIENRNESVSKHRKQYEKYISLESFFNKYFSKEEYDLYLTLVREAVQKANEEIGLHTIHTMSGRNLSNFKLSLLPQFASMPYQSMSYIFSDKHIKPKKVIGKEDYDILNKKFVTEKMYKAFLGNEDFAKCFITSEYLYYALGENELFDYTSVVCGYTKSVEQLIFKLLQINLETREPTDVLWIKAKIPFKYKNLVLPTRPNPKTNITQIQFSSTYQKFFDTSLSPMIWFLYDNANGWNVSKDEARNYIKRCLDDYAKSCRNDHFHKDNIYDYTTVKRIRNNTILIFYYLLGGYKLTNDEEKNRSLLGIESDSFDRLYKRMKKIPSSVKCFILQFGFREIKAIRLYNQPSSIYDDNGSLKPSDIYFCQVKSFNDNSFEVAYSRPDSENMIKVNNNNLPEKVWWYNTVNHKRTQVEW